MRTRPNRPALDEPTADPRAGRAVCVCNDREAAEAGAAMLRAGGNAFDAASAMAFVEAVVAPHNCGIGGYAAAGIGWIAAEGRFVAIDADAEAPAAARSGMFPVRPSRDPNDYDLVGDAMRTGPLSVAVPGMLAGVLALLDAGGRLDRSTVMAPAIALAREGVALPPARIATWLALRREAGEDPVEPPIGAPLAMPELAATLEAIAEHGAEVFYRGRIGRAIAEHLQRRGGILTADDMAAYEARIVEPVAIGCRGLTVATVPPPSGGLTSLQLLALLDRLDRRDQLGPIGESGAFEGMLEGQKVAWTDRLTTLADPAWMDVAPADLLADEHLDRLLDRVREGLRRPEPGRLVAPDPLAGTAHLAAADAEGNVVCWTQTHGGSFGSRVMVPGLGVVLGHGMCRFEPRLGWPNSIAPGKRPLHNMCPVVAVRDGDVQDVVGAAGGRTIVNNVAWALARRLIGGQGLPEVAEAARLHCETIEPALIEESAGPGVVEGLRRRGHRITTRPRDPGVVHLIGRHGDDGWLGVAEPRIDGTVVVVEVANAAGRSSRAARVRRPGSAPPAPNRTTRRDP